MEKRNTQYMNSLRELKYAPEGLLGVGLDEESKDFLQSLVYQLGEVFSAGVDLNFNFGIKDSFVKVVEAVRSAGEFVSDLFKYIMSVVVSNIREALRPAFEFLVDLFPVYKPEGLLSDAFSMAYFSETLGKHVSEKNFISFVNNFKAMKDVSHNTQGAFDFVFGYISKLIEFLTVHFGIEMPRFLKTGNEDLDHMYVRFKELRSCYRNGVSTDYAFAEKVFWLQTDLEGLVGKYSKDPQIRDKLTYLLTAFRPLVDYCERNTNVVNGPRVEPLAILIGGPSGAGKSTFTSPVLLAVMAQILPKELLPEFKKNHNDFMFFRANENEFWDGYKLRNAAVVYDDFGQRRDTAGNPNADAFESIRLINTAPYHLHFSSIEEKQKNFANPKVVFATTNRRKLHFDSVVCSEAIVRRYKHAYIQVPKIEFSVEQGLVLADPWTRRLDLEKVRAVYPIDPEDPLSFVREEVIEFLPWDFATGQGVNIGTSLSFDELVTKVVASSRVQAAKGDMMLKYHQAIKDRYLPEGTSCSEEFYDARDDPVDPGDAKDLLDKLLNVDLYDRFMHVSGIDIRRTLSSDSAKVLLKLGAFASGLYAMVRVYKQVASWFEPKPESTYGKNKGDTRRLKRQAKAEKRKEVKKQEIKVAGESSALQSYDWLTSLMKRNIYSIYYDGDCQGQVLFLKGTTFLCPAHFDYDFVRRLADSDEEDDSPCVVQFRSMWSEYASFSVDWLDITYFLCNKNMEDMDLMVAKVDPLVCRPHRDITKHFAKSSLFEKGNKYETMMPVKRNGTVILLSHQVNLTGDVRYATTAEDGASISLRTSSIMYVAPTLSGDCGSPLVSTDGRFGIPTIVGIHTAGSLNNYFGMGTNKSCAGVLLNKELVEELLSYMDDDSQYEENIQVTNEVFTTQGFNALRLAQQPHMPVATKIVPSPFQGKLWPVVTKPAHLKSFKGVDETIVDPRVKAQVKYLHSEPFCDLAIIRSIAPFVARMILKNRVMAPWRPKIFTFEEAVGGIPGVEFAEAISRSTSPGYPYCLEKRVCDDNSVATGKKYWFGDGVDYDFSNPRCAELKLKVEKIAEDASKGIRNEFIFVDCLKDERRPTAKVDEGKTRQFMACPMDFLIVAKQYFGDFVRHVCSNKIFNGVAVGINPYDEWGTLASYLQRDGTFVFTAGDYSAYDGKIPTTIGLHVLEIIESYYVNATQRERDIRKILFLDIINSLHIADGVVYEFNGGNPSGQPLTAIYNSICNIFLLYACAEKNRIDKKMEITVEELFENSSVITFGDDNIVGYRSLLGDCFEQNNLTKYMKDMFDFTYTNEAKTEDTVTARGLQDITFLKRGFRFERGYDCPLQLDVVLETLNWQKKNATTKEMEERVDGVLKELSLHGRAVFDEYAPTILRVCHEVMDYLPPYQTYKQARLINIGLSL
jgi:hypothetical protein